MIIGDSLAEAGLSLINSLQQQVAVANTLLKKYGLSFELSEIVLYYTKCQDEKDCLAYVFAVKCNYKELCEELRRQIKAQYGRGEQHNVAEE